MWSADLVFPSKTGWRYIPKSPLGKLSPSNTYRVGTACQENKTGHCIDSTSRWPRLSGPSCGRIGSSLPGRQSPRTTALTRQLQRTPEKYLATMECLTNAKLNTCVPDTCMLGLLSHLLNTPHAFYFITFFFFQAELSGEIIRKRKVSGRKKDARLQCQHRLYRKGRQACQQTFPVIFFSC